MKHLTLTFFLAIVLHLVVGVGVANALPQCSNSYWRHNCEDTVTGTNGQKYVGAWKDNSRHGQGTYTYASGNKYVGAYKDHKYHGQGTYTYVDGRIEEGIWKEGKFLYAQKASASGKSIAEKENTLS